MILNEQEVKTCLEFALKPILKKYFIDVRDIDLKIDKKILLSAHAIYQGNDIHLACEFLLSYEEGKLGFINIQGKLDYAFLQLSAFHILKQMTQNTPLICKNNSCYYPCNLPIQSIEVLPQSLKVQLK